MPVPATVSIPMSMHIGAPATPVVKAGDEVKVGQLIAETGGFVSSPVYSGVSGKVKKLDDMLSSDGQYVTSIIIETDGKQEVFEELAPPAVTDLESFLEAVKNSGVVGLGGAGFPTAVKLKVDLEKIEAVIVNGAECEPYITSDTRTMIDDAEWIIEGIKLLQKYLKVKRTVIGIENNKPKCVEKLKELTKGDSAIEIMALPAAYPQGAEKVIIYNTVGKIVPEGKLPIDVGTIVVNCTTLACIAKYIKTGMPLTEKIVTVDGSSVKDPKNVIAPIGAAMKDVFEFCGGFKSEPAKVLYGGPMMGLAVYDLESPILKNTNAILAFDTKDAELPEPSNCIRCGRCISACPINLSPVDFERAYMARKGDLLKALKINLCMECGCCSYVCPAKRQLVQNHKLAKVFLAKQLAEEKAEQEKKNAQKEAN